MRRKNWLPVILSTGLIFSSVPLGTTFAEGKKDVESIAKTSAELSDYSTKDEVIYGKLDTNGKVKNMYVVNSFHGTTPGEIVDYGSYTAVKNLTDLSKIEQTKDNEIRFETDAEEFYYQGELENKPLPWDITINYLLDGKKVSGDDLAGKSGHLEIQMITSANKKIDTTFFENYVLQIALTLDPLIFDDIQAPKGTEANEGKNKLISYMILPNEEEELILSANVTDLEMDPINISAIPANIAIDSPDIGNMTGEMKDLSDAIGEVNTGVGKLNDGISELNSGTKELSDGSREYRKGMNQLNGSSSDLVGGSGEILAALQQIDGAMQGSSDMPDMGELKQLPKGFRDMAKGLRETASGMDTLSKNYNNAYGALKQAIQGIPNANVTEQEIQALYQSGANQDTVKKLVDSYEKAQAVKQTFAAVEAGFNAVSDTLDGVSDPLNEMANQLDFMATGLESGMSHIDELDALAELQTGLATLSAEYKRFHNGLVDYTNGVNELATNYRELDLGMQDLSEGTDSLTTGASELHAGTKKLEDSTSNLPDEMETKIDELMEEYDGSDFEPISFVSKKNENVDIVQFVLKTEKIEIEELETEEVEVEKNKSVWQRFTDLFK